MYTFLAENDKKERLRLTNSSDYDLTAVEGLLPPQTSISTITATNKDGSVVTNTRVSDRILTLVIVPRAPIEENRQRLYKYFPLKKEITLYYSNRNRDVKISGIVETIDGSLFDLRQTITISIRCSNPYFEAADGATEQMARVKDNFEFPFEISEEGKEFSIIDEFMTAIITNSGDIETGLTIELDARATVINPTIYNVDTREALKIVGTLQPGDLLRIYTETGSKRIELIRNGIISNAINMIGKDSDWLTLYSGSNTFTYEAEQGEDNLKVNFYYSIKFEGV